MLPSALASRSTSRDVQEMLLDQLQSARGCDRASDVALQGRCSMFDDGGSTREGKPAAEGER
ncbi:MAG: hypothetical protein M1815_000425 [Lichina confinis]|nr:MAG: hypothetical protein M1815_000425 [Lichina confinis]